MARPERKNLSNPARRLSMRTGISVTRLPHRPVPAGLGLTASALVPGHVQGSEHVSHTTSPPSSAET